MSYLKVQKIKEDVDYYVSSNREAGFEENEFIYDDLHLDEISATLGSKVGSFSLNLLNLLALMAKGTLLSEFYIEMLKNS